MNNIMHSAKGSSWKKGHKYLFKKNGRYYYSKPKKYGKSKNGLNYNWFQDWWGEDEYDDLEVAKALREVFKEQKDNAEFNYSYKKPLADSLPDSYSEKKRLQKQVRDDYRKANHGYMKMVRNYNEKKMAYDKTPKAKVNKFINKGKNFINNIFKKKKK